ncbi:MAG: UDP-N-acetylmuramoyl-L-alanine--D-glutamate ligase [Firmicutes bacterium]|nr:UDP-N-acetylmuramoyl-L-alanine--D-glutamate ligase [Bacillota bacterium]
MNNKDSIKDKKVLVVGMGKSGIAATQAMIKLGAKVSVQDSKPESEIDPSLVSFIKGQEVETYFDCIPEDMGAFDMMILSPGVSPELPFVQEAESKGCEIVGELEIAYRVGNGKYISITGTNGKTTTTTLVGEIFKAAKRKTYVVGNIGVAVISMALSAEPDSWLVTETSSFQLETTKEFKPEISAILNLTPDHLNRHHTMENYGLAKAKTFANQTSGQYVILNYDDKTCFALGKDSKAKVVPFSRLEELPFGAFVKGDMMVIRNEKGETVELCKTTELQIPGGHNVENALAAAEISYFAGIDAETITGVLKSFMGVEHRIESVATVDGVRYINDSKGTNPDSTIKAVEAFDGNIILIAGGYDKGSEFDELIKKFDGKVKYMMLLGKTAPKIKETAEKLGFTNNVMCKDMDECVREAAKLAKPGDIVLLSPACASWDMYTCFEQRGEHFKKLVNDLEA